MQPDDKNGTLCAYYGKTLVEGVARLFQDNVWKLHGLPESIIMDRGVQFTAGIMKELNHMLGICHDLAKWLSHYLIFLFFFFSFSLGILFFFLFYFIYFLIDGHTRGK